MPGPSKRKATLSADLNLEGFSGTLPKTPRVGRTEDSDEEGVGGSDEEEAATSNPDDDSDDEDYIPPASSTSVPDSQPPPNHSSGRCSCPRSQRKKTKHLPHHHKLLNE